MADPKGFLKVKRHEPAERPVAERLGDYREIVAPPTEAELRAQASRCMDCGVPFCHQGCPLGNVIPEFNDLVWRGRMRDAVRVLAATNNFPEVTGRVCPAPCEASCVLSIEGSPVTIKDVERAIGDAGFASGEALDLVIAPHRTGNKVAVVGSGPAGMAAAQQLARAGHEVTLFERYARMGGLLRYGIPDFKMDKGILDRRLEQMQAEGVTLRASCAPTKDDLRAFDATVLCLGARVPRDLPVPGRELEGIHFAMELLVQQNQRVAGEAITGAPILATGKHVVVIGGADTGADGVGTSNRQRAASVTQLELMPKPPLARKPFNPWPAWPLVLRTSSSHEEGCQREFSIMTKRFLPDESGRRVGRILAVRAEVSAGRVQEILGTEHEIPAELVLLAIGFAGPDKDLPSELGVALDGRGNIVTGLSGAASVPGVFAAGDASRGQSLVAWAIADGRRVAAGVTAWLAARALARAG